MRRSTALSRFRLLLHIAANLLTAVMVVGLGLIYAGVQ